LSDRTRIPAGRVRSHLASWGGSDLTSERALCVTATSGDERSRRVMAEPPTEVEVLRRQSVKAWSWFEDTVSDVTADQANWWPPGTANSIGATYLHVVINADVEISRLIHHREPLVEQWDGTVGQPLPYDPDRFDRWVRHGPVDWELLRRYGTAVHASVSDSVERLTEEQLEMPVDMTRAGLGTW